MDPKRRKTNISSSAGGELNATESVRFRGSQRSYVYFILFLGSLLLFVALLNERSKSAKLSRDLSDYKSHNEYLISEKLARNLPATNNPNTCPPCQKCADCICKPCADCQVDQLTKHGQKQVIGDSTEKLTKKTKLLLRKNDEIRLALQQASRELLKLKFGAEPYYVNITVRFPHEDRSRLIGLKMAPAEYMPYTVLYFLSQVNQKYDMIDNGQICWAEVVVAAQY